MKITLDHIGKRFHRNWIFRNLNATIQAEDRIAILGSNGSGKSTLLQVISGFMTPSEGRVTWEDGETSIGVDEIYQKVSICSPAMTVYEEMTLAENIRFFCQFKSMRCPSDVLFIAEAMGLGGHADKQVRHFSSGMKQRVKLGLAILAKTDLLLLDEPVSHLDTKAIKWFSDLLEEHASGRIILVASNRLEAETAGCTASISVEAFRPAN